MQNKARLELADYEAVSKLRLRFSSQFNAAVVHEP